MGTYFAFLPIHSLSFFTISEFFASRLVFSGLERMVLKCI